MKFFKLLQEQFAHPRPNSILYNKYILYFVMFVAIGNLFSGIMTEQYIFASYFVLIGFVLSFFSKNMIVILVLTIALSNIMKGVFVGTALEGFSGKGSKDQKKGENDKKDKKNENFETAPSSEDDKGSEKESEKATAKETDNKKAELVDTLKTDAKELLGAQKNIIQGFQEIEPYMKQAENLIVNIDETTKKIREINSSMKK